MGVADHLKVLRQHGLFTHHGIDLGDGTVAHYLEGKAIIRSSTKEFCKGETYSVVIHTDSSPTGITLRRAMSRIGEQRYNLLFNNCEHFATWCKTGKHRSNQMEDWLEGSSLGAIAIGQLMPAALFTGLNLLLKKGLNDESSREKAQEAIKNLRVLKKVLIYKLESTLEEVENWIRKEKYTNKSQDSRQSSQTFLIKGQNLADQLNAIENVEAQITSLLNTTNSKN